METTKLHTLEENRDAIEAIREFLADAGIVPAKRAWRLAEILLLEHWLSLSKIGILNKRGTLKSKLESIHELDEEEIDMIIDHFKKTPACSISELQATLHHTVEKSNEETAKLRATVSELQKLLDESQLSTNEETVQIRLRLEEEKASRASGEIKLRGEIQSLSSSNDILKAQLADSKDKLLLKETEWLAEASRLQSALTEATSMSSNEVRNLQQALASAHFDIENYVIKENELLSTIESLKKNYSTLSAQSELETSSLRSTISEILNQFADYKAKMNHDNEELNGNLSRYQSQLAQLQSQMNSESDSLVEQNNVLSSTVSSQQEEIKCLREKLNASEISFREELNVILEQRQAVEMELIAERIRHEEETRNHCDNEAIASKEHAEEMAEKDDIISQLESNFAESTRLLELAKEESSLEAIAYRSTVITLQKQLQAAESALAAAASDQNCEDLRQKLDETIVNNAMLEQELKECNTELARINEQYSHSRSALVKLQEEMIASQASADKDVAEWSKLVDDLRDQLESERSQRQADTANELSQYRDQIAALQQELSCSEANVEFHKTARTVLEAQISGELTESLAEVKSLTSTIADLQRKLHDTRLELEKALLAEAARVQEVRELRAHEQLLQSNVESLRQQLEISHLISPARSRTGSLNLGGSAAVVQNTPSVDVKPVTPPPPPSVTSRSLTDLQVSSMSYSTTKPPLPPIFSPSVQSPGPTSFLKAWEAANNGFENAELFKEAVPSHAVIDELFRSAIRGNHEDGVKLFRVADEGDHMAESFAMFAPSLLSSGLWERDDSKSLKYFSKCRKWLEDECRRRNKFAVTNLGKCFALGLGVSVNEVEAARLFELGAELGYGIAQYNIALCYEQGIGVEIDMAKALHWYQMAAETGDPDAQHILGTLYLEGNHVDKDVALAVQWFQAAADQNHAEGQTRLGLLYFNGLGVPKDEREAVKLYRLAAEQEFADAQYYLGVCLEDGIGITRDEGEAARYYRLAADQGNADAQYSLGQSYMTGAGVYKDTQEGLKWLRVAAGQGQADAQYALGVCFADGTGVERDDAESARWYRVAAENNQIEAQYNLGVCYANGIGVAQDEVLAVKWITAAAEAGQSFAQYNLGIRFEGGFGVEKDVVASAKWLEAAAAQGYSGDA